MKHMSFTAFVAQLQENAKSELAKGAKREMEHTDDPKVARKIAKDHVKERPDYYSKLDKCMPEETDVNEISHSKAWKYIHKADDQLKDLSKKSVYGDATKQDYKTIAKRAKGLSMAKDAAARGDAANRKRKRDAAIEKHGTEHGVHQSGAWRMRHYPGKTDAELNKLKDEVKAHNKANPTNKLRVRLQNRLGKNNPNADAYKGPGHKHQYIAKGDAAHHDVYVNRRYEEYEHDVQEGAWADRAAERMGKYHAQSGTTHNLNKAQRMFGDEGAKKYDTSYRDEKKFSKGNAALKKMMDRRDARMKNEETLEEGGFMTVGHKVNLTNPKAPARYTIKSIGKGRDGMVDLEKDGVPHGEVPKSRIIKTNRAAYALKAKQFKGFSEEEEVNELSKKVLGKYIKKAHTDSIHAGEDIAVTRDQEDRAGLMNRQFKREQGIDRAVKRLTKEESEVNELSQSKLKSYVSRVKDKDDDKGIYSDDEKTYEKRRVGLAKARKRGVSEESVDEADQFSRKFTTAMGRQKGALKKAFKSISQRNNIDKSSGATYKKYALGARKALGPKRPVTEDNDD